MVTHPANLFTDPKTIGLVACAPRVLGVENQLRQLQEECTELALAISHYLRPDKGSVENLSEEIADVLLCASQIRSLFPDLVDEHLTKKINRLRRLVRETGLGGDTGKAP